MANHKEPARGPVPQDAIDYLDSKDVKPGFSYTDVWAEEHQIAFTVAKVMQNDILRDIQNSLIGALKNGTTYRDWTKTVEPMLDASGWSAYNTGVPRPARLNVIFDTNMRQARVVGQWQRIQRTKEFRPYLRYSLGPSQRHRPEHVDWAGTTLPVDDPWWDTHTPILGYMCKCFITQESERQAERHGGTTERPVDTFEDFKNPRTGRIERVPKGVDPGFVRNPGADRLKILQRIEKQSAEQLKATTKELNDLL